MVVATWSLSLRSRSTKFIITLYSTYTLITSYLLRVNEASLQVQEASCPCTVEALQFTEYLYCKTSRSSEYHFYGLRLDQTGNRTRADILLVSLLHFWNDTRIRIVDRTDSSMFQNASGNNDTVQKLTLKCCPATFVNKPIMKTQL